MEVPTDVKYFIVNISKVKTLFNAVRIQPQTYTTVNPMR